MKLLFLSFVVLMAANSAVLAQRANDVRNNAAFSNVFANQITFTDGVTSVRFSNGFVSAVSSLGISVSPLASTGIRGANASFPITWGTIDGGTLRGEIMHSRFLLFHRGDAAVKIEGFIIDTTNQPLINGLASANGAVVGRIPLFNVDLGSAQISQAGNVLQISGVRLTLRAEAAAALNAVFSTNAFVEGFNIGTATVSGVVS